jgi:hypothetical protein
MGQFEYVMVLVSIIVGLGIAHILLGIGGIIDRLSRKDDRLELSLAHFTWLADTDRIWQPRIFGVLIIES